MVKDTDLGACWPQILVLPLPGCVILAKLLYIFLGTTEATAVITVLNSNGGYGIK